MFGRSAAHASLRGTFMTKLRVFTVRADAEAKWEAGRAPNTTTRLLPSTDSPTPLPCSIRLRARTASSTIVSSVTSYVGTAMSSDYPVPKPRSTLYGGLPPVLPVSIPMPRFPDKNFVPSPIRSTLVPTQHYPSSLDSRALTVCVDLDAFSS